METQVLIVDDEHEIRSIMRVALEDEHYQVLEAYDGKKAFEMLIHAPQPMVVLLDLMLPRMDGSEIIQQLASLPEQRGRHAIIATTANYRFSQALEHMLNEQQIPMLLKPFEMTDFLDVVAQAANWIAQQDQRTATAVPAPGLLTTIEEHH